MVKKRNSQPPRIPLRDGSGKGVRANIGRAGCADTEPVGRGQVPFLERLGFRQGVGRGIGRGQGRVYWQKWREALKNKE